MQDSFNIVKQSVLFTILTDKRRKYIIISIYAIKEALSKFQHPFIIKSLSKLGREWKLPKSIKVTYKICTADLILNAKGSKIRSRARRFTLSFLFSIISEVALSSRNNKKRCIAYSLERKIVRIKNPKESIKTNKM